MSVVKSLYASVHVISPYNVQSTHNQNECRSTTKTSANMGLSTLLIIVISEFANTVDPDEMAYNEPSHLDLQFLPYSL